MADLKFEIGKRLKSNLARTERASLSDIAFGSSSSRTTPESELYLKLIRRWRKKCRDLARSGWLSAIDDELSARERVWIPSEKKIHFLGNCRPSGYSLGANVVRGKGPGRSVGEAVAVRTCRRSTFCPWCWARETAGFSYLTLRRAVESLPEGSGARIGVYSTTRSLAVSVSERGPNSRTLDPGSVFAFVSALLARSADLARLHSLGGLALASVYPVGADGGTATPRTVAKAEEPRPPAAEASRPAPPPGASPELLERFRLIELMKRTHESAGRALAKAPEPQKSGPVVGAVSYGYTIRVLVLAGKDHKSLPDFSYSEVGAPGDASSVRSASHFARYPVGLWKAQPDRLAPFLNARSDVRLFSSWGALLGLVNRAELAGPRGDDGLPLPKPERQKRQEERRQARRGDAPSSGLF